MKYLIVGYGNIGHKRQNALGNKCVATADPDPQRNATYKDYKEVPLKLFDVAVLTVIQKPKYKLLKYFLEHGKNVLVEKPLLITAKQGKELERIAKKESSLWQTSYNHRYEPNIVKIKELLEKKFIGKLYHARFVYSFGNIKERIGTWRETTYGVLEEIAPHQLDLIFNFFDYKGKDFELISARKVESNIYDHWIYATKDKKIFIETSSVTWKNVFSIDIYGSKGSLHLNGLRKWGGSDLIVRKRVLPSGAPLEKRTTDSGQDVTWVADFKEFERKIGKGETSLKNDLEISIALQHITKGNNKHHG